MDYDAIELACLEFVGEVKGRYQDMENGVTNFRKTTTVNEEITNWGARYDEPKNAVDYLRTTLSDTRKIDMGAIFVSHTKTLEGGLSGARGLASLRDSACYQIELFAEIDPITTEPRPTGRGRLSRPGMPPVDIHIPLLNPNRVFQHQVQSTNHTNLTHEPLEPLMNQGYRPKASQVQHQVQVHEPEVQPPFSYLNPNLYMQMTKAIATGQPKVKTIQDLLGISKGGSSAWQQASSDWDIAKQLMTQMEN